MDLNRLRQNTNVSSLRVGRAIIFLESRKLRRPNMITSSESNSLQLELRIVRAPRDEDSGIIRLQS